MRNKWNRHGFESCYWVCSWDGGRGIAVWRLVFNGFSRFIFQILIGTLITYLSPK